LKGIYAFFDYLDIKLKDLSTDWANIPMLARTHGQPASQQVKKFVFVERLEEQMRLLFNIPFAAKFGGTGNYNAHHVAYPQIDWRQFDLWETL
jgi:adenylosuccinate lyase